MEDKKTWTKMIEQLLAFDPRSDVTAIEYTKNEPTDPRPREVIRIYYRGGAVSDINVSCNSLGAILNEIVKEVYYQDGFGTFFRGFPKEEEVNE